MRLYGTNARETSPFLAPQKEPAWVMASGALVHHPAKLVRNLPQSENECNRSFRVRLHGNGRIVCAEKFCGHIISRRVFSCSRQCRPGRCSVLTLESRRLLPSILSLIWVHYYLANIFILNLVRQFIAKLLVTSFHSWIIDILCLEKFIFNYLWYQTWITLIYVILLYIFLLIIFGKYFIGTKKMHSFCCLSLILLFFLC